MRSTPAAATLTSTPVVLARRLASAPIARLLRMRTSLGCSTLGQLAPILGPHSLHLQEVLYSFRTSTRRSLANVRRRALTGDARASPFTARRPNQSPITTRSDFRGANSATSSSIPRCLFLYRWNRSCACVREDCSLNSGPRSTFLRSFVAARALSMSPTLRDPPELSDSVASCTSSGRHPRRRRVRTTPLVTSPSGTTLPCFAILSLTLASSLLRIWLYTVLPR
mmetsp:Transcript_29108/g.94936  ORF Transcript_29108/g.94936 Transcript_29108/m.94936 type:complete len:225 (-) Transcript_29108:1896-2570(-)